MSLGSCFIVSPAPENCLIIVINYIAVSLWVPRYLAGWVRCCSFAPSRLGSITLADISRIVWNRDSVGPCKCGGLGGMQIAPIKRQATGLDAWASRVKCPARFVSHLHEICMYIWVVYSLCFFCCLFITVTWWYVWCFEWASGNQEEVQACLVTLWLFIISCYSLYKTTLGLLCSWFENNPHFHKYSMDFHV